MPSSKWLQHFYNYKFWIGDHYLIISATCLHCYFTFFLLIIDVRITTFTHQLLSKNINPQSLIMQVRIFQSHCYGVRRCVAHGLCRSRFYSTTRKVRHHVMRCSAKTSYPTSRWDVAITNGQCSRTVLPITLPETQKLAAWEPSVHWTKHFVHRISRIWTRLTCHLWCSSADGLPSSKFLLSWQNEESNCQKHAWKLRHGAVIANSSLLSPFYLRLMLFARWRHYFPRLIQINYGTMFKMKRPWFTPNLVKICCSILLKL